MKILSIGTDLVERTRVESLLRKQGEDFPRQILSSLEMEAFRKELDDPVRFLSQSFAGKEAVYKLLRSSLEQGIQWSDVEIKRRPQAGWQVHLSGKALERATQLGLNKLEITFSHAEKYFMATVIGGVE